MNISIIVPCFNVRRYIDECLASVLAQTVGDWECLCIDDGSKDGTGERLDEYGALDGRIKVIHQQNAGVGASRNHGIEMSTGEWLVFLDGDDVLRTDMIERLQTVIGRFPTVDMVQYGSVSFDDGSRPVWITSDGDAKCVDVSTEIRYENIGRNFWTTCYRRTTVPPEFKSYIVGEDLLFLTESVIRAKSLVMIEAALYGYRVREGSVIHSKMTPRKMHDTLLFSVDKFNALQESGRRLDPRICRYTLQNMTECYLYDITRLPRDQDRKVAWQEWYEQLRRLKGFIWTPPWYRFCVWMCSKVKSHLVARILFEIPFRIKQLGVHR